MADDPRPPRLTRTRCRRRAARTLAAFVAVVTLVGLAAGPAAGSVRAQTEPDPVAEADATIAQLRARADALSGRYFEALGRLADVQARVDEIERRIPELDAETRRLRSLTQARAVVAYKRSGRDLGSIIDASGPLDAARRAQWLDRLNHRDDAVAADLRDATDRLASERSTLRAARDDALAALAEVNDQGKEIDALLTDAQARRAAAVASAATAPTVDPVASPAADAALSTPTTTTDPPAKNAPPDPPPAYAPTPGVHPHHDEPFLVCTRARESSGNYAAYNPAGPYMGAYQFLQATWNSAANHVGRPELIGVAPSTASQYDQDDLAWAVYQWQGSGPWGGACEG